MSAIEKIHEDALVKLLKLYKSKFSGRGDLTKKQADEHEELYDSIENEAGQLNELSSKIENVLRSMNEHQLELLSDPLEGIIDYDDLMELVD